MEYSRIEWLIVASCFLVIVASQQIAWMKGWLYAWHERRVAMKAEGSIRFRNLRTPKELVYDYGFQFAPLMILCYVLVGDSILSLIVMYFCVSFILTTIEMRFAKSPPRS